MLPMLAKLNGYKTYIVSAVTIAFTLVQLWQGAIDTNTAIPLILGALGLGAVRHGISTSASK